MSLREIREEYENLGQLNSHCLNDTLEIMKSLKINNNDMINNDNLLVTISALQNAVYMNDVKNDEIEALNTEIKHCINVHAERENEYKKEIQELKDKLFNEECKTRIEIINRNNKLIKIHEQLTNYRSEHVNFSDSQELKDIEKIIDSVLLND